MCGIAGIFCFKQTILINPLDTLVRKMTNCMAHRGPDADGFYINKNIALGHRRLAIIDLTEGGRQPMTDSGERFWITFNGEIFNYLTVKKEMSNYSFRSQSDTEVILAAYQTWGKDCVKYLKGQFAFAIWDNEEQTLFLGRDRMGEKPLYYYQNEEIFIFASEINALLESGLVPKKLSNTGLIDYLKYQSVNSPMTILEKVYQIPKASIGIVKNGKLSIETYWDIVKSVNKEGYEDYNTVKKTVHQLLHNSVESQMMSDVPLGAFLSGGIDSSAMVGLMAESSTQPIHTFSVIFDDVKYDERLYSNLIAKKFNTKHEVILLDPQSLIAYLPNAFEKMDVPSGDGVNTFIIAEATKKAGITVAISGLGGDELFAGYPSFANYYRLVERKGLWKVPQMMRAVIANGLRTIHSNSYRQKLADLVELADISLKNVYPLARRVFSEQEIHQLIPNLPILVDNLLNNIATWEQKAAHLPILSQYSIAELSGYTENVLLKDSDCMGMAHSLEIRVPFFDSDLLEYVLGVPDNMKYPKMPKKLLVESLGHLLPSEIINRPKMGFSFPWDKWLRNELQSYVSSRMQSLAMRAIFDKKELLQYYKRFQNNDPNIWWSRIWLLVCLEDFLAKHQF